MATTTARSSTVDLLLYLSLSTASKVIAKAGGGRHHHRADRADGAFRCRTCGRRFATFQALGGHRTSHNRPRVRADGLDLLLGARPGKGAAGDVHRCNACGMVFPTGQALGGHMRRHRTAVFDVADAAVPETTTTTSFSGSDDDEGQLPIQLIKFI
ncbi:zinc finger protein ZAT11-like [Panicum virgatum]|uniref:C2H2-type domain-containing protein n=1 Tax=Panicum virgatum TaxID=38727 RepID=A0A8T0PER9_PANVG|nr:zinc finger protein ZAT11-like [Panicum virgatum]KAG2559408.1 hypothetical protein PVAP13_8NG308400 [Panicum virgatum]